MTLEPLVAKPSHPLNHLPSSSTRIVLTGFMGAGKSSVGRLLAARLGWRFLDLDDHLEARAGASIPELFALHGEARFRRLESGALANALGQPRTVLALGGGTPELLANRLLLEQTPNTVSVLLHAPFPVLYDRCMLQSFASPTHERPVLRDPADAERRFHLRMPLYRRLARLAVDTSSLTTAEAADHILEALPTPADRDRTARHAAARIQQ